MTFTEIISMFTAINMKQLSIEWDALPDRFRCRRDFGTNTSRKTGIFDIAAGVDGAVIGSNRGAHCKFTIRTI